MTEELKRVEFIAHATFKLSGKIVLYTDPYQMGPDDEAGVILVTHSHFDHCSPEDIRKLCGPDTAIVCSMDCVPALSGLSSSVQGLQPGEEIVVHGVRIKAVPAYNRDKDFHPRSSNWNGYVFEFEGTSYYHTGDTDLIPEMKDIETDVAFLPVGGTYTMDYREAGEAVSWISPRYAIPMHYGSIVGSSADAEKFAEIAGDRAVIIPPKNS